jgi:hypothetical protein
VKSLGRPRHRQDDNINMFLKTLGVFCEPHSTTSEFNLAVLSCKHGNEHSDSIQSEELNDELSGS